VSASKATGQAAGPSTFARTAAGLLVTAGLVLLFFPSLATLGTTETRALGLVLIAVGCWSTEVLPPHLTSFVFFLLAVVFEVAVPGVVFSGFHSGAVWLIFSGIVLGIAIQETGLGTRLAEMVLARVGHSYARTVIGVSLAAFALSFVMPSAMSRVVMLTPILVALAGRMGYAPGSMGRDGIVLAATFSTVMAPMTILPATVPNVVMSGLIESIYGITLQYGAFLSLFLPVTGLLALASGIALALLLFRNGGPAAHEDGETARMSGREWRLAAILLLTLLLWATDAVHGVSPAWIALGAAVICLLPRVGLVPAATLGNSGNYSPWFFVAGIVGLGAVVADSGLARTLGALFIDVFRIEAGQDAYNFAAVIGLGSLMSLAANAAGSAAVLTPLGGDIANATGWPLLTALLAQVNGYLVIYLPYQTAPILTAVLLGGVHHGRAVRMCLAYSAVYLMVIAPLGFLWWRWLGMFGPGS